MGLSGTGAGGIARGPAGGSAAGMSGTGMNLKGDTGLAADLGLSGSLGGVPSPGRPGGTGRRHDRHRRRTRPRRRHQRLRPRRRRRPPTPAHRPPSPAASANRSTSKASAPAPACSTSPARATTPASAPCSTRSPPARTGRRRRRWPTPAPPAAPASAGLERRAPAAARAHRRRAGLRPAARPDGPRVRRRGAGAAFAVLLFGMFVLISALVGTHPDADRVLRARPRSTSPSASASASRSFFASSACSIGKSATIARPFEPPTCESDERDSSEKRLAPCAPGLSSATPITSPTAQNLRLFQVIHLKIAAKPGHTARASVGPGKIRSAHCFGVEWVESGWPWTLFPRRERGPSSVQGKSHPPHGGSLMARMHWLGLSLPRPVALLTVGCVPQEKYNAARSSHRDAANERLASADAQAKAATRRGRGATSASSRPIMANGNDSQDGAGPQPDHAEHRAAGAATPSSTAATTTR